jgi:hypothetical protein
MKILFDQGTPKPLKSFLLSHEVVLASTMGWSTLQNGDLLAAAEAAGFELMITTDKNLAYQQNLSSRKIGILVLGSGQWPRLSPVIDRVIDAVALMRSGDFKEIDIPYLT